MSSTTLTKTRRQPLELSQLNPNSPCGQTPRRAALFAPSSRRVVDLVAPVRAARDVFLVGFWRVTSRVLEHADQELGSTYWSDEKHTVPSLRRAVLLKGVGGIAEAEADRSLRYVVQAPAWACAAATSPPSAQSSKPSETRRGTLTGFRGSGIGAGFGTTQGRTAGLGICSGIVMGSEPG